MSATRLLQELIRIDTTNPPGNETAAARVLEAYLADAGIRCELVARDPARANLVARLPGGSGPTLAFLGHLDTVDATPECWRVDPWSGELRDGAIWGRGAVDMKCWLAASAAALADIARSGNRPGGDLLLIACADEEKGDASVGAPWLVEARPDLSPAFVVNEGAGERFEVDGTPYYLFSAGEKAGMPATLTLRTASGDPSARRRDGNLLSSAARLLERLADRVPVARETPEAHRLLELVAPGTGAFRDRVVHATSLHPVLERLLPPLTSIWFSPTILEGADMTNVLPDEVTITIATYVQPGVQQAEVERELREALGPGEYELELGEPHGGTRSALDTPLHSALAAFVDAEEPGARLAPTLASGYTDSHVFREAFGSVAYGFVPFRYGDPMLSLDTKHAHEERILVADLEHQQAAARFLADELWRFA